MSLILRVSQLSKIYHKGHKPEVTLSGAISQGVKKLLGGSGRGKGIPFHALKNVSFEVEKGEVLGIIGANGAGKSTLLRILSRVTYPDDGKIEYFGRFSSVLNIGTGFHADLTGRENIFLNGELLGLSRSEIEDRFDTIHAFSGIGDFIDTQVKHYSSGMFLRLAFSLAFHSPIDLLFLDEVLSVGDAAFRMKSLNKIRELTESGTSIVLVTHNLNEVTSLCKKTLWLDKGEIKMSGPPGKVVDAYLAETYSLLQMQAARPDEAKLPFELKKVAISACGKTGQEPIYQAEDIEINLHILKKINEGSLEAVLHLHDMNGYPLLTDTYGFRPDYQPEALEAGNYQFKVTIPGKLLNQGYYRIFLTFSTQAKEVLAQFPDVAAFRVQLPPEEANDPRFQNVGALLRKPLDWEIKPSSD